MLFLNVFETENRKPKNFMCVSHLYSEICDILLVLFKLLSKRQNKNLPLKWDGFEVWGFFILFCFVFS